MKKSNGIFVISLDFELLWGNLDRVHDKSHLNRIDGVKNVVREILRLFTSNNIHATWATVGFLFHKNINDLRSNISQILPKYENLTLSPYKYIESSYSFFSDHHFAPDLIQCIRKSYGQEVGTHTYSHFYCLESGQTLEEFYEDVRLALECASRASIEINSFVFPRNQINKQYLPVLSDYSIKSFRGNQSGFAYEASPSKIFNQKHKKIFRIIDTYFNLSGYNTFKKETCSLVYPYNIQASHFLRPYSSKLFFLEDARFRRIIDSMTHAAINNEIYHLWWHPHNFGINTSKNILFLERIINHFKYLRDKYGMSSLNMEEISSVIRNDVEI